MDAVRWAEEILREIDRRWPIKNERRPVERCVGRAEIMVQLSDADLLARMKNFEDHFVERKTVNSRMERVYPRVLTSPRH